ncbi:MAG: hypothetical protein A2Y53_05215 [Chloroflexi bacterium RBG_16_47_49]|nr:MAG: hypothetical protein A2Y53_05215 [Chloroflexi bacterium RBG_16_47_49]
MIGPLGKFAPTGKGMASVFGWIKVAPWIFCKAVARGSATLFESNRIDDILICPYCSANLENNIEGYTCVSCSRFFPITEGIIDFRLK